MLRWNFKCIHLNWLNTECSKHSYSGTEKLQWYHDFDMPYLTGETCTFISGDTPVNDYYSSTKSSLDRSTQRPAAAAKQGDLMHIRGFFSFLLIKASTWLERYTVHLRKWWSNWICLFNQNIGNNTKSACVAHLEKAADEWFSIFFSQIVCNRIKSL